MNCIIDKWKTVQLWRFIAVIVLLLGVPLEKCIHDSYANIQSSFQESMLSTLGFPFPLYLIFLLLIADLGFDQTLSKTTKNNYPSYCSNMLYIALVCLVFFSCLTACTFLAFLIKAGTIPFSEELTHFQLYGLEWMSASSAVCFSGLLLYLYFVFITAVVFCVNSFCKKRPLGYVGALIVLMLDRIVQRFDMVRLGIFPSTYSSIDSALVLTSNTAINIAISIIYWLLLIAGAGASYNMLKRRSERERRL